MIHSVTEIRKFSCFKFTTEIILTNCYFLRNIKLKLALRQHSTIHLFVMIVILVIIDTSILEISSYLSKNSTQFNTVVFTIMVGACGYTQYQMLKLIKAIQKEVSIKKSTNLHIANTVIPLVSVLLLVSISIQMYSSLLYHALNVQVIIWMSNVLGIANMVLLTYHFFRWFQFNRNYLIILYLLSIILLCVNLTAALIAITNEQFNEPVRITSTHDRVRSHSSIYDIFNYLYDYTSIASFVLLWVSSILMLLHYSKKYGPVLYSFITVLPLIYFLSRFSPLFSGYFLNLSFDYPIQAQIVYTIILTSGKPIGGFLFGLVFWLTSRNVSNKQLSNYLLIAGCGVMLLFTSNQVMYLSTLGYPPFGIITISFVSIASYLLFIGIYSSSICVAQDKELRMILRKSHEKQQNLMNQIGSAHMDDKLLKTAKSVMMRMEQSTGIKPIEEDNYQMYIEEVIREIKNQTDTTK